MSRYYGSRKRVDLVESFWFSFEFRLVRSNFHMVVFFSSYLSIFVVHDIYINAYILKTRRKLKLFSITLWNLALRVKNILFSSIAQPLPTPLAWVGLAQDKPFRARGGKSNRIYERIAFVEHYNPTEMTDNDRFSPLIEWLRLVLLFIVKYYRYRWVEPLINTWLIFTPCAPVRTMAYYLLYRTDSLGDLYSIG